MSLPSDHEDDEIYDCRDCHDDEPDSSDDDADSDDADDTIDMSTATNNKDKALRVKFIECDHGDFVKDPAVSNGYRFQPAQIGQLPISCTCKPCDNATGCSHCPAPVTTVAPVATMAPAATTAPTATVAPPAPPAPAAPAALVQQVTTAPGTQSNPILIN